jgi:hypothetical protein
MDNKKSVVEEALLQMKSLENAISENAKGILASTMKEEISELVRESIVGSKKSKKSLYEQDELAAVEDEEEEDLEDVEDLEDEEGLEDEEDLEDDEDDVEDTDIHDLDSDNHEIPPLDMTTASPEEVLKVFRAMGDEDGIIVKKDNGYLHLTDNDNDSEYLIQMGSDLNNNEMANLTNESVLYELHLDDDDLGDEKDKFKYEFDSEEDEDEDEDFGPMRSNHFSDDDDDDNDDDFEEEEFDFDSEEEDEDETNYELMVNDGFNMEKGNQNGEAPIYELMVDDSEEEEEEEEDGLFGEGYDSEEEEEEEDGLFGEGYDSEEEEEDGLFGEGYDSEEEEEEVEFKESSRTLGNGRTHGRNGLPKPKTYSNLRRESVTSELNLLKEKNEEYKKALDFFRNKLNEVAIFNSNLAYSTRLFTEHSTTKQEKINILRRFDNVESIKESKSLYKNIKDELVPQSDNSVVNESVHTKITKTPSNGSSSNLIESKTYENPQFMRMKDLMGKIK